MWNLKAVCFSAAIVLSGIGQHANAAEPTIDQKIEALMRKEEPRFLAGDDDSGEERNASITYKLFKGRKYIVRLRLYYPGQLGKTSVMYS